MVQLRVQLQGVQEEVQEVEIQRHGQADRLLPGVLGVTEAPEVEEEVAREDDHAEDRVDDVDRPAESHEDADDADDDQTEQGEHQVGAHAGEIDAREEPDYSANSHDTGGASEDAADGLPAQLLFVRIDHRSDEQPGHEGPSGQCGDADAGARVCGEEDADCAQDEGDAQADHGGARANVATAPGSRCPAEHAHREQEGDFDENAFHVFCSPN